MSGKSIALTVAVLFVLVLLCGGGGAAVWYFKYGPGAAAADVGPLPGRALALPADTALAAGFDARGFFASAGYKQISSGEIPGLGQAVPAEELEKTRKELREGVEKGLAEAEQKTGIRFDRDLDRVALGLWNVGAEKPDGALVALGRFDRAKVLQAMGASLKAEGGSLVSKTVSGVEVQVLSEKDKPTAALAFLDDTTLVLGSIPGVEAVVTSHATHARPLEGNASLMGLIKGLDPASGYWVVLDSALTARAQKEVGANAPPGTVPRTLTLSGKFDGGLSLAAEMADDAAAKNLGDMIQGGLAMARMQIGQNPEAQKVPGLNQLLEGIQVKAEGKKVTLSVPAGGPGLSGALAAIAIPSLLRARVSANEASAIGDIRTVLSAEAAYSFSSGGSYGDLGCLAQPGACLDGYGGPAFVDAGLAGATEKGGYKRAFQGGPAAARPRNFEGFAYTATPLTVGQTGTRSFCGDASGLICFDPTGAELVPEQGACPSGCQPLDGGMPEVTAPPRAAPREAPPIAAPRPTARPTPRPTARATPRPAAPTPPPAVVEEEPTPAPRRPAGPVRVGGDVPEPRKLKHVNPVYPNMAKQARVQGIVILECTIDTQGRVSDVRVLRGVPLLDPAAIEAVRQWVYEPTRLNGVPVPVIMTVTVNFRLN